MISAPMLVRNPPMDRLSSLIEFMQDTVAEFVIVDTGSSEEDKDIMRTWRNTTILEREWRDDFAWARNEGLEQCKEKWILHLDPDEIPSLKMIDFIKNAVLEDTEVLGWLFWTRNFWFGRQGPEQESDWHCRLFKRESGRWYKPVHEQVALNGKQEHETRNTPLLPKAPYEAMLIHAKPADRYEQDVAYYTRIESGS